MDRYQVSCLLRTIFGLASGRIRNDYGDVIAVANAIAAFSSVVDAVDSGDFNVAERDYTGTSAFQLLLDLSDVEDPVQYANSLSAESLDMIANAAESFFSEIVYDEAMLPMQMSERRALLQSMANA